VYKEEEGRKVGGREVRGRWDRGEGLRAVWENPLIKTHSASLPSVTPHSIIILGGTPYLTDPMQLYSPETLSCRKPWVNTC